MYLELLKEHVKDNKYTKWYVYIIQKSQIRDIVGYTEKHHILPKSFKLGGEKDKENIAVLTAREHFICHRLLVKMMIDPKQKMKMQKSVWLLYKNLSRKGSRAYEYMRIRCNKESSELMKTLWKDPDYIEKQSMASKTKYKVDGYSEKRSELTKKQMSDQNQIDIVKKTFSEAHKDIDHSSKEWTERSFNSVESKTKSLLHSKSDENRNRCRERELNKGIEYLSALGKTRAKIAYDNGVAKFGSEELYKAHLSERKRGFIKMININTLKVKMVKNPQEMPSDWKIYKNLTKEERKSLLNK